MSKRASVVQATDLEKAQLKSTSAKADGSSLYLARMSVLKKIDGNAFSSLKHVAPPPVDDLHEGLVEHYVVTKAHEDAILEENADLVKQLQSARDSESEPVEDEAGHSQHGQYRRLNKKLSADLTNQMTALKLKTITAPVDNREVMMRRVSFLACAAANNPQLNHVETKGEENETIAREKLKAEIEKKSVQK